MTRFGRGDIVTGRSWVLGIGLQTGNSATILLGGVDCLLRCLNVAGPGAVYVFALCVTRLDGEVPSYVHEEA